MFITLHHSLLRSPLPGSPVDIVGIAICACVCSLAINGRLRTLSSGSDESRMDEMFAFRGATRFE